MRGSIASRRFLFMIDHAAEEDIHLATRCAGKRIGAIVAVTRLLSLSPSLILFLPLSLSLFSFSLLSRFLSYILARSLARSTAYWNFEKPGCSGRQT